MLTKSEGQRGNPKPDPRLFVASVERAMQVLEAFDAGRRSLTIAEITERSGLGRSAAQRFVYTLHHLGYLRRDVSNKHYRVSHKVIDLAHSMIGADTLSDRVASVLERLAEQTGETVAWVEQDDLEIVILKSVPSRHLSSVNLPVGQRFAALSSSSGQVLLAHAPKGEILRLFHDSSEYARRRVGWGSEEEIAAYFSAVREAGFALTEKMEDQDSLSLSSPVFGSKGMVVGAINISTLKTRFTKQQAEKALAPALLEGSRLASELLGRAQI